MRRAWVLFAALLSIAPTSATRSDESNPATWDVVLEETMVFEDGQAPVVLAWSDGLRARRFHMSLESNKSFDATLVRALDGTILYQSRRSSHHRAMIPWGLGETAHLTIDPRENGDVRVMFKLTVDPRENGLAVYSLEVNRFLHFYELHDMGRAKEALALALSENPADSIAIRLWTHVWKSESDTAPRPSSRAGETEQDGWRVLAERLRLDRMGYECDALFTEQGFDAALAYLEDDEVARPFRTRGGQRGYKMLLANVATRDAQDIRAVEALEDALDRSEGFEERVEIYRLLVEACQRRGSEGRARSFQRQALKEAPDDAARQKVEEWLPSQG